MLLNNNKPQEEESLSALIQEHEVKTAMKIKEAEIAAMQKLIEPITEAIEELTAVITEVKNAEKEKPEPQEYYDKDLNKNLTQSIDKVFGLLQNIKQPKLDLSPITSIISEIKNQNTSLINLINNLSKNGNETLVKEALSMIHKSNEFISKGFNQADYSKEIKEISSSIESNKPTEWEFKIIRGQGNIIDKVTAVPKLKK